MKKYENMVKYQKQRSMKKVREVKKTVLKMKENNERITPYTVWRKTGCSKSFIYTRKEVFDFINLYRTKKATKS